MLQSCLLQLSSSLPFGVPAALFKDGLLGRLSHIPIQESSFSEYCLDMLFLSSSTALELVG